MDINKREKFCFPKGRLKALVLSYDDGSEHDRRLIDMMNANGIRGTFHLNSGKLGGAYHVLPGEISTLYKGHEVSSHTVNHLHLEQLDDTEIRREILNDRKALEDLTGYPVRGMSIPFGTYDQRVLKLLPELGIEYARGEESGDSGKFDLPPSFILWPSTAHHTNALQPAERFLSLIPLKMMLFIIWGHSYELDGFLSTDTSKGWKYMEYLCERLGGQKEIWYSTMVEVMDYLKAIDHVKFSADETIAYNPSALSVWLKNDDAPIEVKGGELKKLPQPATK